VQGVVAKHVADVLAEEALDALPEFLDPVHVGLCHPPGAVRASGPRANSLIFLFTAKFQETSSRGP